MQEVRAGTSDQIASRRKECEAIISAEAMRAGVLVASRSVSTDPPARMSRPMMTRIARHCDAIGLSHIEMLSGAGHDAQSFAGLCETGMIFVPSAGGVSHNADEHTEPDQIAAGLQVLIRCIAELVGLDSSTWSEEGSSTFQACDGMTLR
jgi:N-carbamoyl-L-amino-acid hydrolase